MRNIIRALRVAALALLALLAATGSSSAYTATVSPAGAFRLVSSGRITYSSRFINVQCAVTLSGTLASRVVNIESGGESLGAITEATAGECSSGSLRLMLGPAQPILISTLLGTLPNAVTGILWGFPSSVAEITDGGITCLYAGFSGMLMAVVRERGGSYIGEEGTQLTELDWRFVRGSILCQGALTARGDWEIAPSQTITIS